MNEDQGHQVLSCVEALLREVERDLLLRVAPASEYARLYASAGLGRGADLLGAAVACLRAERSEAVGVLVRAIVDTWFLSLYLLKGGPTALGSLEQELNRNHQLIAQRNGVQGLAPLLDDRGAELRSAAVQVGLLEEGAVFERLSVEKVASALMELPIGNLDTVRRYELLYRSYSTFDAHGLGPIERRIDTSDLESLRLREVEPWIDPHASIGLAALLVGEFAIDVMGEFDLDADEIAAICGRLDEVMRAASGEALATAPPHVRTLLPPDLS